MAKRVSHSLLDPFVGPPIKALYGRLGIPRWFPPEGIVGVGHLSAICGAAGFAWSAVHWWGGLLLAVGVVGNHFADCIDGTHARTTGQCRNGGELLDHFTDPLSFAYWIVGWTAASGVWPLGMAGVMVMFSTAVLTNIKAKIIGEFTLATLGPTEFKASLVVFGLILTTLHFVQPHLLRGVIQWSLLVSVTLGVIQLIRGLALAVQEVNERGAAPDTSEWETVREKN